MKVLLTILTSFFFNLSFGQLPTGLPSPLGLKWYQFKQYATVDSGLAVPIRNTTFTPFRAGFITFYNGKYYGYNGSAWKPLGASGLTATNPIVYDSATGTISFDNTVLANYLTGTFNQGQIPYANGGNNIHSMSSSQLYQTSYGGILIGPEAGNGQRLEVSGTGTFSDYVGIAVDTARARLDIAQDTGILAASAIVLRRKYSSNYNSIIASPTGQWNNIIPNKSGTFAVTSDITDALGIYTSPLPSLNRILIWDGTQYKASSTITEYADNAAALLAGLSTGAVYRTGDNLKIVH